MADCEYCKLLSERNLKIIHEDDRSVAFLNPKPSAPGHVLIISKEHFPIIENVPDFIVADMFKTANKISSAVFEALGMQGTNIIVQNGTSAGQKIAHFCIHIIPRRQGDRLNFTWQPKQLEEEEMSTTELKIKEHTSAIGSFEKEKKAPVELKREAKKIEGNDKDNYLIKQLRRIP